jgi:hypothetical protein
MGEKFTNTTKAKDGNQCMTRRVVNTHMPTNTLVFRRGKGKVVFFLWPEVSQLCWFQVFTTLLCSLAFFAVLFFRSTRLFLRSGAYEHTRALIRESEEGKDFIQQHLELSIFIIRHIIFHTAHEPKPNFCFPLFHS